MRYFLIIFLPSIRSPLYETSEEWIRFYFYRPGRNKCKKDFIGQAGFTGVTGFFSPSARSPFGRRPFHPDDPVQFSFKDENPFLFLPYFNLRFFTFLARLKWPFFWPAAPLVFEFLGFDAFSGVFNDRFKQRQKSPHIRFSSL